MKKNLIVAAAIAVLTFAVERSFRLEEDPIRSLVVADPMAAALFDHYQERSPFRGRIFVERAVLTAAEEARVSAALAHGGYREVPFLAIPDPGRLLDLASQLPADEVARLASEEALRERVAKDVMPATVTSDPAGRVPGRRSPLASPEGRLSAAPAHRACHVAASGRTLQAPRLAGGCHRGQGDPAHLHLGQREGSQGYATAAESSQDRRSTRT